jgi:hypothetical protein
MRGDETTRLGNGPLVERIGGHKQFCAICTRLPTLCETNPGAGYEYTYRDMRHIAKSGGAPTSITPSDSLAS